MVLVDHRRWKLHEKQWTGTTDQLIEDLEAAYATKSAGRSTKGSRSRQASASESALAEEPVQTTSQMEEPSHPEFDTDFSNFLINQLKVDTLTPELLAGLTYELMKGSCKSLVELKYHLKEVFQATTDQLDWVNPKGYDKNALWGVSHWGRKRQQFYGFAVNRESAHDVYSKRRIIAVTELKIVEWHSYKHLDWITLTNLTVEERFAFNVSLRMFTRSIVIQRRVEDLQLGVESYQKKLNLTKPDRLMRIDELHKFHDGTLTDVRTTLDDRLKGIRMRYLPQTIWRNRDKDRAAAMIQAIDKRLKKGGS
nr:hypothetical protein [Tanacetum cinerariifolium]